MPDTMSRWHEFGCRRPDVDVVSGIPCCNYCFALALQEDITAPSIPPLPRLRSRARMNLTWPSVVSYSRASPSSDWGAHRSPTPMPPQETTPVENARNQDIVPKSQCNVAIFPEIMSDDEIRLLRLRPGQPDGPIHAYFEGACLRSSPIPVYEALSYTWADESGDSTRRSPIFIGPYWDIIYVTHNCEQRLESLKQCGFETVTHQRFRHSETFRNRDCLSGSVGAGQFYLHEGSSRDQPGLFNTPYVG